MSFAFLPFYTGDYLRDTRHLTPLKHGVYVLLLFHCWDQQGPLPLDEQECAGIANCRSADEVEALRYVLDRFFTRMDDGWYNNRMQREVERAVAISNKRKSAGHKGYLAKARQLPSKRQASASTLTTTTTLTTTLTKTHKDNVALARDVLTFLNEKSGRHYRPLEANLRLIMGRLRDGATVQELRQVIAKKCREWQGDEKMMIYLRPATLFNATKFAQYQGELNADGVGIAEVS